MNAAFDEAVPADRELGGDAEDPDECEDCAELRPGHPCASCYIHGGKEWHEDVGGGV